MSLSKVVFRVKSSLLCWLLVAKISSTFTSFYCTNKIRVLKWVSYRFCNRFPSPALCGREHLKHHGQLDREEGGALCGCIHNVFANPPQSLPRPPRPQPPVTMRFSEPRLWYWAASPSPLAWALQKVQFSSGSCEMLSSGSDLLKTWLAQCFQRELFWTLDGTSSIHFFSLQINA